MTTEATDAAKLAEQALANSGEQGTETSAVPATRGAGEPGGTPDSFVEEDARMAAAEAELAKLEGTDAGKETEGTEVSGIEKTAAATTDEVGKAAAKAGAAHTPEVRAIIALRTELGQTRHALAVAQGEAKAFKSLAAPAGTEGAETIEQVEPPTVEEALADVQARREALAMDVDAGKLTMVDYTKQSAELDKIVRDATIFEAEERAREIVRANQPVPVNAELETATTKLISDYPIISRLTKEQLDPIKLKAEELAAAEGIVFVGDKGTKLLRERMAALAEQTHDPDRYALRKAGKLPGATGQNAGNVTVLPTAAEREAKLRLAAEMPPEIGATGAAATAGQMTDAQIEAAMSGNEDQRIAFQEAHPHLYARVMGDFARAR